MSKPLRVLLVEDNEDDAMLVLNELRRGGYTVTHHRVDAADAMREALAHETWDIVISDYSMPNFSGPRALALLHESEVDVPFIMLSGTIGEDTAVAALKAGAHDFMVKSNLARLIPAIERELKDAESRRAHRDAAAEVKQLEEQVRQAQKMEAVGRLAGGVAHDFNNILTAILATADLALEAPNLEQSLREDLESIRESGHRAAAITRQLLAFSRKQVVQPRAVALDEIVARMDTLLKRLLPPEAKLEMRLASTGILEVDPTQIEQVLLNLVVNASDAMPQGGSITVSTADFETTHASSNNGRVLRPGRHVVLRVQDTGTGMDEATIARIFEPFFTTKEPGRGTGLGLATVYGIVEQCGGQIFVHSRPGEGSTFEICLPRLEDTHAAPATTRTSDRKDLRGSEVILVVEDEAAVRAPICRMLRKLGYYVLEAKNGEDALNVLNEHHAPVHLVITDVVMPEMSGTALVEMLHSWYPHLKVLFISGYNEEHLEDQGLSAGAAYLAKPFTAETIAAQVRALLAETDAG